MFLCHFSNSLLKRFTIEKGMAILSEAKNKMIRKISLLYVFRSLISPITKSPICINIDLVIDMQGFFWFLFWSVIMADIDVKRQRQREKQANRDKYT